MWGQPPRLSVERSSPKGKLLYELSSLFYLPAVFDDLYDAVSFLWSWRWPETPGEVTAVDVERVKDSEGMETFSFGRGLQILDRTRWSLHRRVILATYILL